MGFFGLFVSMIGLGAMAKDAISNSIFESDSYQRAVKDGYSWYFTGNGSQMKSVKTGRLCTEDIDYKTGRRWLVDLKTGEKIEDITAEVNKERELKIKQETYARGVKFYRTTRFDCPPRYHCDIYVNDDMPGRYFSLVRSIHDDDRYVEGKLVDCGYPHGKKKVEIDLKNLVHYKPDGTRVERQRPRQYNR